MEDSHADTRRLFEYLVTAFIFLLVLGLYPFSADPTGDIKALHTAVGSFLLCAGWLFTAWWQRISFRRPVAFSAPLAGLIALYLLASVRSAYPTVGFIETGRFISLAALYFVASQVYTTPEAVLRLLKALVLAALTATLYGFLQAGGFDPVPWDAADKKTDVYTGLPASYGNPNFAAHVMVLTLPIAVFLLARQRTWLWLLAAVATLIHLRLTGQRASYIALAGAVTLAAVAWSVLRTPLRGASAVGATFGAWALLGLFGLLAGMGLLAWRTGSPLPLDTSLHIRYWSYVSATDMIQDAPLLGHGPGAYAYTYHKYWTQLEKEWFVQESRKNKHVHNDLMEISIDAGIPAAGLYLLLLVLGIGHGIAWSLRAGPGQRSLGILLSALFAGFLIDGLFGFNLRVPVSAGYLFLLLGALEGLLSRPAPERATRRWPQLATAAVVILAFIAISGIVNFSAATHRYNGDRLMRADKLDDARKEFLLGDGLTPWDAQFALQSSKCLLLGRDLAGAVTEINRSFQIDPNYFPARLTLARYQLLLAQRVLAEKPRDLTEPLQHLEEARKAAQMVIDVCGDHPVAERLLGRAASATAIALTTADPAQGAQRARAYWEESEKHLQAGLRNAMEEAAESYRVLAQVKIALGKPAEAEEAYSKAAKADPADPATWGQFLAFANGNRRYERIRNNLIAALGTLSGEKPPRNDVLSLLHMCLANVRENGFADYDKATDEYYEAAAASPLSPEVWTNYARFAYQRDRSDRLKASLKTAQETLLREKKEVPAQLRVAFAALQGNPKAIEDATAVLAAQVRSFSPKAKLTAEQTFGWTAHLLREVTEKEAEAQSGIARLNLGIAYAQFKQYEIANALFAASRDDVPAALAATHAAMWSEVLLELNRGQEAIDQIKPLRASHPDDFDLRHAYARALVKVGRLPEAKDEYTKLLAEPELNAEGRALIQQEADKLN